MKQLRYLLPRVLPDLQAAYPDLRLHLREGPSDHLPKGVVPVIG